MEDDAPDSAKSGESTDSGNHKESSNIEIDNAMEVVTNDINSKLALLQELYQRKNSEIATQYQPQPPPLGTLEYLQLLNAAIQQQQQSTTHQQLNLVNTPPTTKTNSHNNIPPPIQIPHPLLRQVRQTSSEQSTDENMDTVGNCGPPHSAGLTPSTPLAFSGGASLAPTPRSRRTYSGSGQTISQHTRDRLKTMIASKKQKQRLYSSSSAGSTQNIANTPWQPSASVSNSETSFFGAGGGGATLVSSNLHSTPNHFEPYPQFSAMRHTTAETPTTPAAENVSTVMDIQPSVFQLRKVNSEPNLKMRIRARLLNKGTSPHQQSQSSSQQSSANSNPTALFQRSDSDVNGASTEAARTALILNALAQQQQVTATAAALNAVASSSQQQSSIGTNLMMPSPSLPNLLLMGRMPSNSADSSLDAQTDTSSIGSAGSQQFLGSELVAANLLMQMQAATFASYLSMPSLLHGGQLTASSMFRHNEKQHKSADSKSTGGSKDSNGSTQSSRTREGVRFDTSFGRTPNTLPIAGSYPSLLKQQLRDLVLRRKSLVREEPEEEQMEIFSMATRRPQQKPGSDENSSTAEGGISSQLAFKKLKTGLAYDLVMVKHQCMCGDNNNHVEHGGRVQSIWARLQEVGLLDICDRVPVRKASPDVLQLVHSIPYVGFFAISPTRWILRMESPQPMNLLQCGGIGIDLDTYYNFYDENAQNAICVAAGLLVELCCQVAESKVRNGFACIRPPGHHAEREQAMGFCFCNNVAIATRYLQKHFAAACGTKIAIIDWDVHHGNGTQICFESDSNVLYISLHRHDNGNFFPGTGAVTDVGVAEGRGYSVNIPFSGEMMGDAEYLAAWRVLVLPLLDSFKPSFIIVSSGFDGAKGHSAALGGYHLSPKLFGYFTRTLMAFADGRVVLALEGGYDLTVISDCAEECVRALTSHTNEYLVPTSDELDKIPNNSAQETMQKVIAVHKKMWPCLTGIQGINTSELHWQTLSQRFSSLTVQSS